MADGIFITGTDTGVGKSVVSAALAILLRQRGVKVGVMKPVTSGCIEMDGRLISEDAELLAAGAGIAVTDEVAPYLLREPVAPSAAAEKDGIRIEFSRILAAYHSLVDSYDFIVVEGAGGLMVPLAGGLLVADLVKLLALPLMVVARPGLGTVNHTLLTCFAARQLELDLRGVVVNGFPQNPGLAESTAPHMIDSLSGAPLLGRFPQIDAASSLEVAQGLALWLSGQPSTRIFLREIGCD
ncbi:MAG TPA: dethiobiotin synthase [Geobacteraceae bacterium]|nr:dethiobiotin synthase [Geobacteraceae bacterium]